jgi:Tfp pilus assembly protein PilZ
MDPDTPQGSEGGGETAAGGKSATGAERRQWSRRTLPFGRGAVLQIGDRSHIVGLGDLSEGGAFLVTRAPASVGETALLKLSMVSRRVEVSLCCTVVRAVHIPSGGPQRGLAVRFDEPDDEVRASIAAFVARAPGGRRP